MSPMASAFSEWLEDELASDPELRAMVQEESLNADIATQIYNARTEAGLSQAQLADLIETSQSTIARLEDADYEGHSLTMLKRITSALHKDLRVAITDICPNLDMELRYGGRLRDYIPVVRFSAERLVATFPRALALEDMLRPGVAGVVAADEKYRHPKGGAFESFAIPFIRAAMLTEVQCLSTDNRLKKRTSRPPIRFTDLAKAFEKDFAIPRKTIAKTISDFSQFHFVRLPDGKKEREVLLFTKVFEGSGTPVLYLAITHQTDHAIEVAEVYRIRRDLADGVFRLPPLDVLRLLVEKFGLPIAIGETTQKFILSKQIQVKQSTAKLIEVVRFGKLPKFYLSSMVKVTGTHSRRIVDCALAYCIDHDKYREWAFSGK